MKILFLAVLCVAACIPVYAGSQATAEVVPEPVYYVTVSKAGEQGWKMSTAVGSLGSFHTGSFTFADGKELVATTRFGHGSWTDSSDYLSGCQDGKFTLGTYATGTVVAIIDDQLVVSESRLMRMDQVQVADCIASAPVISRETWTATLPTGFPNDAEAVPAPAGFRVVLQAISK